MGQVTTVLVLAVLHSPLPSHWNIFNLHPHLKVHHRAYNVFTHFDEMKTLLWWAVAQPLHYFQILWTQKKQAYGITAFLSTGRDTWGTEEPKCQVQSNGSVSIIWPESNRVLSGGDVNLSVPLGHPLPHLFSRVRVHTEIFCTCPGNCKHNVFLSCVFSTHSYMWTLITHSCFSIICL